MRLNGHGLSDVVVPPAPDMDLRCTQCGTAISQRAQSGLCDRCRQAENRERRRTSGEAREVAWPVPLPQPGGRKCDCGARLTDCMQYMVPVTYSPWLTARCLWLCADCADWFEEEEEAHGTMMRRLPAKEALAMRGR